MADAGCLCAGVVCGPILAMLALVLLGWNEFHYVSRNSLILKVESTLVKASCAPEPKNDGKLIFASCDINKVFDWSESRRTEVKTFVSLTDETPKGVRLIGEPEIIQNEVKEVATKKHLKQKTYTVEKKWTKHKITSYGGLDTKRYVEANKAGFGAFDLFAGIGEVAPAYSIKFGTSEQGTEPKPRKPQPGNKPDEEKLKKEFLQRTTQGDCTSPKSKQLKTQGEEVTLADCLKACKDDGQCREVYYGKFSDKNVCKYVGDGKVCDTFDDTKRYDVWFKQAKFVDLPKEIQDAFVVSEKKGDCKTNSAGEKDGSASKLLIEQKQNPTMNDCLDACKNNEDCKEVYYTRFQSGTILCKYPKDGNTCKEYDGKKIAVFVKVPTLAPTPTPTPAPSSSPTSSPTAESIEDQHEAARALEKKVAKWRDELDEKNGQIQAESRPQFYRVSDEGRGYKCLKGENLKTYTETTSTVAEGFQKLWARQSENFVTVSYMDPHGGMFFQEFTTCREEDFSQKAAIFKKDPFFLPGNQEAAQLMKAFRKTSSSGDCSRPESKDLLKGKDFFTIEECLEACTGKCSEVSYGDYSGDNNKKSYCRYPGDNAVCKEYATGKYQFRVYRKAVWKPVNVEPTYNVPAEMKKDFLKSEQRGDCTSDGRKSQTLISAGHHTLNDCLDKCKRTATCWEVYYVDDTNECKYINDNVCGQYNGKLTYHVFYKKAHFEDQLPQELKDAGWVKKDTKGDCTENSAGGTDTSASKILINPNLYPTLDDCLRACGEPNCKEVYYARFKDGKIYCKYPGDGNTCKHYNEKGYTVYGRNTQSGAGTHDSSNPQQQKKVDPQPVIPEAAYKIPEKLRNNFAATAQTGDCEDPASKQLIKTTDGRPTPTLSECLEECNKVGCFEVSFAKFINSGKNYCKYPGTAATCTRYSSNTAYKVYEKVPSKPVNPEAAYKIPNELQSKFTKEEEKTGECTNPRLVQLIETTAQNKKPSLKECLNTCKATDGCLEVYYAIFTDNNQCKYPGIRNKCEAFEDKAKKYTKYTAKVNTYDDLPPELKTDFPKSGHTGDCEAPGSELLIQTTEKPKPTLKECLEACNQMVGCFQVSYYAESETQYLCKFPGTAEICSRHSGNTNGYTVYDKKNRKFTKHGRNECKKSQELIKHDTDDHPTKEQCLVACDEEPNCKEVYFGEFQKNTRCKYPKGAELCVEKTNKEKYDVYKKVGHRLLLATGPMEGHSQPSADEVEVDDAMKLEAPEPLALPKVPSSYAFSTEIVQKIPVHWKKVPLKQRGIETQGNFFVRVDGSYIWVTKEKQPPSGKVGEVRGTLSVSGALGQQLSIIAEQGKHNGDTILHPWNGEAWVQDGRKNLAKMISQMQNDESGKLWGIRLGGFALVWLGLFLMLAPLAQAPELLPFCGECLSDVACCLIGTGTFFVAACASGVVIAAAWVAARPIIGIPLLAGCLLLLCGCMAFAHSRKKTIVERKISSARESTSSEVEMSVPQPQLMTITCPEGAGPGMAVQVPAADGTMKMVTVPDGVYPGQDFQCQV